jgi:hypothetical protein
MPCSNAPQPITAALLLDLNWETESYLLAIRDAASHLVDAMLPGDRLRLGTFGIEFGSSASLTDDKPTLSHVLRHELWPEEAQLATPFFGAIDRAMDSFPGEVGRRALVVLSGARPFYGHYRGQPCGPGCMFREVPLAVSRDPGPQPGPTSDNGQFCCPEPPPLILPTATRAPTAG